MKELHVFDKIGVAWKKMMAQALMLLLVTHLVAINSDNRDSNLQ